MESNAQYAAASKKYNLLLSKVTTTYDVRYIF